MITLPHPVGVGVKDKAPLQHGADYVTEGMMHNPVPEWRGADQPSFGIVDKEAVIVIRPVCFVPKLGLECNEIVLQAVFEAGRGRFIPLALARLPKGEQEVVPGVDRWVEG